MKTAWPDRTSSWTPAGVIATRYSWFLSSLGTPTFMPLAPSRAPGRRAPLPGGPVADSNPRPSALACPGFPEHREPALTGGVRGQDTYRCHTIVQFTPEEKLHRLLQGHPGGLQLCLLVAQRRSPLGVRNLGQAPGQVYGGPLGGDPR